MTNKKLLNNTLKELIDFVKSAKNLVLAELPDVAKQLIQKEKTILKYKLLQTIINLILSTILITLFCLFFKIEDNTVCTIIKGVLILSCICSSLTFINEIVDSITYLEILKVSPKIFIIDELRKMLK